MALPDQHKGRMTLGRYLRSINRVRGPGIRLDNIFNPGPNRPEPQRAARSMRILEKELVDVMVNHNAFLLRFCLTLLG
jgi:hypothetical protein